MKFGLFFVMQRPDHLSERYIYETEMRQMVAADGLGYDPVWIAEHHFSSYGVCSAPQVLAAAVAGQTKGVPGLQFCRYGADRGAPWPADDVGLHCARRGARRAARGLPPGLR